MGLPAKQNLKGKSALVNTKLFRACQALSFRENPSHSQICSFGAASYHFSLDKSTGQSLLVMSQERFLFLVEHG